MALVWNSSIYEWVVLFNVFLQKDVNIGVINAGSRNENNQKSFFSVEVARECMY